MGSFKLGGMTLKSLFSKPETIMYPLQERYRPEGLKGHIVLDAVSCILCGACQRACPSHAITVDKAGNSWSINRFLCVQCRACIDPCAKDSLSMADTYTPPATQMGVEAFEVHPPERPARKAKPKVDGEPSASPRVEQSAYTPEKADDARNAESQGEAGIDAAEGKKPEAQASAPSDSAKAETTG